MKNRFVAILLVIISIALTTIPAAAQQTPAGPGLEISPPLREIQADPGKSVTTIIKIRNITKNTVTTKYQINDFVADGEDGQPKLLLGDNDQSPYSIKKWVSPIANVSLGPNEQKSIEVNLAVPQSASPGGHYGVIRFTSVSPDEPSTGVSLSASVGALFLVKVSGKVTEQAKIADFYTSSAGKKRSLFEYGPITLTDKLQNTGNVHFKPKGSVRITNMLGRQTALLQVNERAGTVLPNSTRKFEQSLNKKLLFGRYTAHLSMAYGSNGQRQDRTISFWVIPYKLIFVGIGLLILALYLLRYYNHYVVKRALKRSKTTLNTKNTTLKN